MVSSEQSDSLEIVQAVESDQAPDSFGDTELAIDSFSHKVDTDYLDMKGRS